MSKLPEAELDQSALRQFGASAREVNAFAETEDRQLRQFAANFIELLPAFVARFEEAPLAPWGKSQQARDQLEVLRALCVGIRRSVLPGDVLITALRKLLKGANKEHRRPALLVTGMLGGQGQPLRTHVLARVKSRDAKTRALAERALDLIEATDAGHVNTHSDSSPSNADTMLLLGDTESLPAFDPEFPNVFSRIRQLERTARDLLTGVLETQTELARSQEAFRQSEQLQAGEAMEALASLHRQVLTVTSAAIQEAAEQALRSASISYSSLLEEIRDSEGNAKSVASLVSVLDAIRDLRVRFSAPVSPILAEANALLSSLHGIRFRRAQANRLLDAFRRLADSTESDFVVDGFPAAITASGKTPGSEAIFNVNEKGVPAGQRRKRGPRSFPDTQLRVRETVKIADSG